MLLGGGWIIRLMKIKVYGWGSKVLVICSNFCVLHNELLIELVMYSFHPPASVGDPLGVIEKSCSDHCSEFTWTYLVCKTYWTADLELPWKQVDKTSNVIPQR